MSVFADFFSRLTRNGVGAPSTPAPSATADLLKNPKPSSTVVPEDDEDKRRAGERNLKFYERNKAYALPGPYVTKLSPAEERQFQAWVKKNNVPMEDDGPHTGYDMRGFWKAKMAGDPRAQSGVNAVDKRLHFSDYWKTPYHESFNRETKYSKPNNPIHWDYSVGGAMNPVLIGPEGVRLLPMKPYSPEQLQKAGKKSHPELGKPWF